MTEKTACENCTNCFDGKCKWGFWLAGVMILTVVAGLYLRNLNSKKTATTEPTVTPVATGVIKGLACEKKYYNPVVGLKKYYISVEGVDLKEAKKVTCDFNISVNKETVVKTAGESPLTALPEREGSTFRCSTNALELEPIVPTNVDIVIKDDLGKSTTCSAIFTLPKP